jgi:hypothetical protein
MELDCREAGSYLKPGKGEADISIYQYTWEQSSAVYGVWTTGGVTSLT